MRIDVTFAQNDMALRPAFDTMIQIPGGGGIVFVPEISEEGILSWTNNGDLPNPAPTRVKGKDGYTPVKGKDYFDGTDGKDGYTPVKGKDYFDGAPGKDGINGTNGVDGKDGTDGQDGYTPVKGTDYWTEADRTQMVADVIAALPVYNGEVV